MKLVYTDDMEISFFTLFKFHFLVQVLSVLSLTYLPYMACMLLYYIWHYCISSQRNTMNI